MLHVILYNPEIPPNTGNIIRLCANSGATLHLIHPLGFELDERRLRRAGLDYREWASLVEHRSLESLFRSTQINRLHAFTTRGEIRHDQCSFSRGDALLFGPESRGLPDELLAGLNREQRIRLPMVAGSRSINLSNAVAIALYEAWRQLGFAGAGSPEQKLDSCSTTAP